MNKKTFSLNDFKEIWEYKELLYFFTWRDLKVRYKTAYWHTWALIQPGVTTMIVFSVFFGAMAKVPSGQCALPYFRLCRPSFLGIFFFQRLEKPAAFS